MSSYHEEVKCENCLFARSLQENPDLCWCRRRQLKSPVDIHSERDYRVPYTDAVVPCPGQTA
jgi:hypothetical protein